MDKVSPAHATICQEATSRGSFVMAFMFIFMYLQDINGIFAHMVSPCMISGGQVFCIQFFDCKVTCFKFSCLYMHKIHDLWHIHEICFYLPNCVDMFGICFLSMQGIGLLIDEIVNFPSKHSSILFIA